MSNYELVHFAKLHSMNELTSEDIMKLLEKPYLIKEIEEAFNLTKDEFNKIRKKHKIESIVYETILRDLITILYFTYNRYPNIDNKTISEIIDLLINNIYGIAHSKTYQKRLCSMDLSNTNINKLIKEKNIDISYRRERCDKVIYNTREYIKTIKEQTKNKLYNELLQNKKNQKFYKMKDLTRDILYELAINENIPDSLIADIFNISKGQVANLRYKYDIENKFLKRAIDHPEYYVDFIEKKGYIVDNVYNPEFLYDIYNSCKELCDLKNWRIEILDKYVKQKMKSDIRYKNAMEPYIDKINIEYDVTINNNIKTETKKRMQTKSNGKKVNQVESNSSKISSGKLGEKIVYDYEKNKLKNLRIEKEVVWITKTEDENITLDGLGYDIISYNEKGEKIYIEVKCSTTNFSNDLIFNISEKEVQLMNGKFDEIDKNHCFIYYVHNVNKNTLTAEISIINSEIFSRFNLKPIMYKVEESSLN